VTGIAVVIPARNAAATLGRTLAAIAAQTHAPTEVVVVDDGSTDDTGVIAARAGVRVLRQSAEGPAAARNRGAAATTAPLIAFTDADCFPAPDWLAAGVRALASADFVQGAVRPERPPGPFDRTLWVERRSGLWESANVLVRRDLFDAIGGFEQWIEPEIGKAFGEDMWLGWRAARAGALMRFAPDALVEHAVFDRGPRGYVDERRRLRYFPAATARMPELREAFLHRRWFLNAATAEFDIALIGAALAAVLAATGEGSGRATRAAPIALAAPFALRITRRALPHRRRAPLVAATEVAAHAVGAWALAVGSIRHRTPVL
jgi:glycosyltransferase involved in cell wall biosynthesis